MAYVAPRDSQSRFGAADEVAGAAFTNGPLNRESCHDADGVNAEATNSLASPVIEELPDGGFGVMVVA